MTSATTTDAAIASATSRRATRNRFTVPPRQTLPLARPSALGRSRRRRQTTRRRRSDHGGFEIGVVDPGQHQDAAEHRDERGADDHGSDRARQLEPFVEEADAERDAGEGLENL